MISCGGCCAGSGDRLTLSLQGTGTLPRWTSGSRHWSVNSARSIYGYTCWKSNLILGGKESMDMIEDAGLSALLALMLGLGVLLVLTASAALGRKLSDLEYQIEAGINGIRRIQSHINVRVHANRVLLGLVFIATNVLTLADAPLLWRTWIGRVLFILVLVDFTMSAVLDWFSERQQVRLLLREKQQQVGYADETRVNDNERSP